MFRFSLFSARCGNFYSLLFPSLSTFSTRLVRPCVCVYDSVLFLSNFFTLRFPKYTQPKRTLASECTAFFFWLFSFAGCFLAGPFLPSSHVASFRPLPPHTLMGQSLPYRTCTVPSNSPPHVASLNAFPLTMPVKQQQSLLRLPFSPFKLNPPPPPPPPAPASVHI